MSAPSKACDLPCTGNPILPGIGLCDPHVRVFQDRLFLYATHDKSAANRSFVMEDWWVWTSTDLGHWTLAGTLRPEQTFFGRPDFRCWAVDAMDRDGKYFLYFSRGPAEIGVVVSRAPNGPWADPLGRPLISDGTIPTQARDPGLFREDDGACFIVFGLWTFHIARLGVDMISLDEPPRPITIRNPSGPYGPGKTDDKPYLHKRGNLYYLSWGCYYAISESLYGPYENQGSIIREEFVDPSMRDTGGIGLDHDRHGSFFEWQGRWYFICNELSRTRSKWFRDTSLCLVDYASNGRILPLRLTPRGVPLAPAPPVQ